MLFASQMILAIGLLLMFSILASRVTDRMGAPLLLVFLIIGMLVGEDGLLGIRYDDVRSAHLLASLALAVILFDGGLRTQMDSFRAGLKPALSLATLGVIITSAITGVAAAWLFQLPLLHGLLIGAIVGSTDAAAVFYMLNAHGLHLNDRVRSTLELESGSNDPMAVFLTIVLIELIAGEVEPNTALLLEFAWQMGVGGAIGIAGGLLLTFIVNRLRLASSLYPLLALAGGLTIYGAAAVVDASGFLATFLGGIIAGHKMRTARGDIRRFHDGMAWLSQIGLFLILGLLVVPHELMPIAPQALLIALVLVFIARPLAVLIGLLPFRFAWRERLFICWVGLRGAVPIVLGLYPLLLGVTDARIHFNIAFFVVLVSLLLQGWTVAPVARWMKVEIPSNRSGKRLAEFDAPGLEDMEVVVYRLPEGAGAEELTPHQLLLPSGGRVLAVIRDEQPVQDVDHVQLQARDLVYLLAPADGLGEVEALFGGPDSMERSSAQQRFFGDFVIDGQARLGDLADAYGIVLSKGVSARETVADLFRRRYARGLVVGDRIRLAHFELIIRALERGEAGSVGLKIGRRKR
ncbi:potassium/proton antiporter [Alkalilimnicola sp. S0819]|uniref:potassium/proton antiporter n=1 Tax=Alkalilimnicola sp. S0819 TaxID=2613922 RepID=UPI0012621763|nr:potassium/proton antiporter [Alkalilimnicola sp. S0819]KAB7619727.1 potassium/proton antiporter [Alkalilimnicola sp. S0819]MPQ17490.1 potassium/proton antiporter [Alkalilimnicola sp. S0819]